MEKKAVSEEVEITQVHAIPEPGQQQPLIWIDLEMTGLDHNKEQIIEIAVIITDGDLNNAIKGPNLIIKCPDAILDNMDAWCTQHHGSGKGGSGLADKVRASKISLKQAEEQILKFLQNTCGLKSFTCPLAGSSNYTDKVFMEK